MILKKHCKKFLAKLLHKKKSDEGFVRSPYGAFVTQFDRKFRVQSEFDVSVFYFESGFQVTVVHQGSAKFSKFFPYDGTKLDEKDKEKEIINTCLDEQ